MDDHKIKAAVMEVPFEIFELRDQATYGLEPGFYYTIPMPDDEKVHASEIPLAGPYGTRQEAFIAVRNFIEDAIKGAGEIVGTTIEDQAA
jgi:hypothetical protein